MQVTVRDIANGYVVVVPGQPEQYCSSIAAVATLLGNTLPAITSAALNSVATAATSAAAAAPATVTAPLTQGVTP